MNTNNNILQNKKIYQKGNGKSSRNEKCTYCLESFIWPVDRGINTSIYEGDDVPTKHLDNFNQVVELLLCHDVFCRECIDDWATSHTDCPMCRLDYSSIDELQANYIPVTWLSDNSADFNRESYNIIYSNLMERIFPRDTMLDTVNRILEDLLENNTNTRVSRIYKTCVQYATAVYNLKPEVLQIPRTINIESMKQSDKDKTLCNLLFRGSQFDYISDLGLYGENILDRYGYDQHESLLNILSRIDSSYDVRELLKIGFPYNTPNTLNPLNYVCKYGTGLRVMKLLLLYSPEETIPSEHHESNNYLHQLCLYNQENLIDTLLTYYATTQLFDINSLNNEGYSALHIACISGSHDITLSLLDFPTINVNLSHELSRNKTPLHFACIQGNINLISLLISMPDIDINAKDDSNLSPLYIACSNNRPDIVTRLLMYMNNGDIMNGENNWTSLNVACYYGYTEIVATLVESRLVNVNLPTSDRISPLYCICSSPTIPRQTKIDIVRILLGGGASTNTLNTEHNITPIFYAIMVADLELLNILLDESLYQYVANRLHGYTPLQYIDARLEEPDTGDHNNLRQIRAVFEAMEQPEVHNERLDRQIDIFRSY